MKKLLLILLCLPLIGWSHDVSESTVKDMTDASLIDFIYFGAEHMVTGYDHILFLIGVVFFLSNYFDIFKFITAFTIAHCITLVFATFYGITANAYLIDAVIAFSVIYKGFENLDGFKKYFSFNPPNLILMVFIFGLIHGFGLSTRLQEVSNLSLYQILSFNVGVEFGQIAVLVIVFLLLSIIRGKIFNKISRISNWILVVSGVFLLVYQLNGYFTDHSHEEDHKHEEYHVHDEDHNHDEEHTHDEDHNHEEYHKNDEDHKHDEDHTHDKDHTHDDYHKHEEDHDHGHTH
ncbi:MAG: HupE/UreJ family protein [Flavobacteriales bacterium]|jgi:hydrogenase/urease accessory protein HupE|nr:HupE/UreJ family protein [Flavobacteriales bacterium]